MGLPQVVGGKVYPLHQRSAVDPLVAGMPALHSRRVHQVHAHVLGLLGDLEETGLDLVPVLAHQAHGAHHHLGRILDLGESGVLETLRVKQHPQHFGQVVAGIEVGFFQFFDGFRVLGRSLSPGRNRHFISDKEAVKVPGKIPGGPRLLANDFDDVVSVPRSGLAHEGLHFSVMVGRVEAELPRAAAVGERWVSRRYIPAGESMCAGLDVIL